jgi:hypothetical protein
MEELAPDHHVIEEELLSKRLGNVKLFASHMAFEWKDGGEYRELANESRRTPLKQSMSERILRVEAAHRMTGCLPQNVFESSLHDLKDSPEPVLTLEGGLKVEMQSGKHRMRVLKDLSSDPEEHWWIVTIYDDSRSLSCAAADNLK